MGNNYSSSPPPKITLPPPPQVEVSHEVHRLANNVFECVFSPQIGQKTHFKYKLIVTCSSQEPTVEEFSLSGDSFNQDTNMAFISFMVDENQVFSSRIETMTGVVVHSLDNFSTTSFKPATKKLLKRKMDKKEIMDRILESMKKINQEIVISTVSIASSGKSTILNTLLRVLGSMHLSFRQGNTDMMEKAYQILESASQLSAEFMGSFSKDIVKQTIDDVAQFHFVNLQDVPGMFTFSGTNGPRLFKFSKELLAKVFTGTVKEFAQPDSVFIPIPLKDATMYSTRNSNSKGLADFFQSTMSYVENEYSVPCVICYSHVDRCYLFDNYIGKGRILLDARGKSATNRNTNLKLDLLKYFYEWDLIHRYDGTFPDIVESTHNIPFISNYDGDEEIQELFECMHLELFLLLIEQAYAKISSRKTIKLELIKKE